MKRLQIKLQNPIYLYIRIGVIEGLWWFIRINRCDGLFNHCVPSCITEINCQVTCHQSYVFTLIGLLCSCDLLVRIAVQDRNICSLHWKQSLMDYVFQHIPPNLLNFVLFNLLAISLFLDAFFDFSFNLDVFKYLVRHWFYDISVTSRQSKSLSLLPTPFVKFVDTC